MPGHIRFLQLLANTTSFHWIKWAKLPQHVCGLCACVTGHKDAAIVPEGNEMLSLMHSVTALVKTGAACAMQHLVCHYE